MKQLLLIFAIWISFCTSIANSAGYEDLYSDYLDGDRSILFCGSRGEYAWYIEKKL